MGHCAHLTQVRVVDLHAVSVFVGLAISPGCTPVLVLNWNLSLRAAARTSRAAQQCVGLDLSSEPTSLVMKEYLTIEASTIQKCYHCRCDQRVGGPRRFGPQPLPKERARLAAVAKDAEPMTVQHETDCSRTQESSSTLGSQQ